MGKVKKMLDTLIAKRANGNHFLELDIQMKLLLKGINYKLISEDTPDDPVIIGKLQQMADQFNITLDRL